MWPDATETQNLLHRVAEADASATDELWERYRPALRRMIGLRLDQALSRRGEAGPPVPGGFAQGDGGGGGISPHPHAPFFFFLGSLPRGTQKRRPTREPG